MSAKHNIDDLENIIRALADIWPADRDNVAAAGAQFEEFISGFNNENLGQLQKLIDISWEGFKYLYTEDKYFLSVKAATMQAVNTVREYLVNDGDIEVKDFEKAYDDLDDALTGKKESADTLIEIDENNAEAPQKQSKDESAAPEETKKTLDDLASFIIELDHSASEEQIDELYDLVKSVTIGSKKKVAKITARAGIILEELRNEGIENYENWLSDIAAITEKAIKVDSGEQPSEDFIAGAGQSISEQAAQQEQSQADENPDDFYIPDDIETAMVGEFVTECTELLEMAEGALLDLEESPDDDELINKVFRAFHTIKGTSAFMGLQEMSEFTHLLETMLSMVRDGEMAFDSACADISLEAIDVIINMLDLVETAEGGEYLPKPLNFDRITVALKKVSAEGLAPKKALAEAGGLRHEVPDQSNEQHENRNEASNSTDKPKNTSAGSQKEASVRVNVSRLDGLIDMIGELVIAHSVVAQDESVPDHSNLQKKISHTSKILRELQDTSLNLRMIPLKATFHRMNRLVRDISRKAGKSVKFTTHGEDTEIDRNMVDIINEPLVHLVRNALDHGIEPPEERRKNGKTEQANLRLRASQEGGKVVIEIEDDGRGINKKKVLEKAISKGLVETDANLSDKEIHNLIFLPGFSSVDKVTDLSGRGVGMDVVRKSIEELKGKIDIESREGKGTKITIELPFTLAITDGMLVKVGSQRFIIPTLNIDRAFRVRQKDVITVMGKSEKVSIRGETIPVIRLHKNFGIGDGNDMLTQGTFLSIRNAHKKYALMVDEVIDQQQLVGKSININSEMGHISGGAILGDGTVGLILDTAALMKN